MSIPEFTEQHIRDYIHGQWKQDEDPVRLVQHVRTERILGEVYAIYDVHCEDSRWWVVSNPMNLYDQHEYPSYDMTLSLHVGISARLANRGRTELEDSRADLVAGTWRRFERGEEMMNAAEEAEDFQGVGIQCREALISLVRDAATAEWVGDVEEDLKAADVKGWGRVFARRLSAGRVRSYLTDLFSATWDLTVWLQHKGSARDADAELVLDATAHLIGTFALLVAVVDQPHRDQCPRCSSYRIDTANEYVEEPEGGFWEWVACAACGWAGERSFTSWEERREHIAAVHAAEDEHLAD